MKKIFNLVFGGLQHKIFNLVLVTIILIVGAYTAVLFYQANQLQALVSEASEEQGEAVRSITGETMNAVLNTSLKDGVGNRAYIADNMFSDLLAQVRVLAEYTQPLLADPSTYGAHKVNRPKAENDGTPALQLMTEANVDLTDRVVSRKVGVLGNLENIMSTLYSTGKVDSVFVATTDGLFVIMDDRSGDKFAEDGTLKPFPTRARPWYRGAVRTKDVYFTDLEYDAFTGKMGIVCAIPVYVDDTLVAVAGADLFMDTMSGIYAGEESEESFSFVVNKNGKVIYSPITTGIFAVDVANRARDLRKSEDEALARFVSEAMQAQTETCLVSVGGRNYFMAGAPLPTVGWSYIYAVDEELVEQPATMMQDSLSDIYLRSRADVENSIRKSLRMILILLVIITLNGSAAALALAKKIVKPLNTITKRISELGESNSQFMMEDIYRTGDEIEVLATAFADISAKTVQYIREITSITAEKERIGAELDMAKSIQESQLPSIFPAYPSRPDFDIYASMTPAREVGGDFYDFFLIDDNHLGMVIADVSGKGVPAALYMMISKILIKNRIQSGETPGTALANVNAQLMEGGETDMFVTVWLCILDIRTGKGIVANAGHEHPALRRAGSGFELVKYRHSPAVGMMEGLTFAEHEFQMNPGDTLFVYTDGVAEANNAENELFGTDRMLETLNKNADADPEALLHGMLEDLGAFAAGAEQFDDITMMCLKYVGNA